MKPMTRVIVSQGGFAGTHLYDLIESNLTVVNLLRDEGYPVDQITAESRASYWVDFYLAQMNNGGFPQFVYNTRWAPMVIGEVEAGLVRMRAGEHLDLFRTLAARVAALPSGTLDAFLASDLFGDNPIRDQLSTNDFFPLNKRHGLIELNHGFLRGLPNLTVLSIDDMFAALEDVLGRPIAR